MWAAADTTAHLQRPAAAPSPPASVQQHLVLERFQRADGPRGPLGPRQKGKLANLEHHNSAEALLHTAVGLSPLIPSMSVTHLSFFFFFFQFIAGEDQSRSSVKYL